MAEDKQMECFSAEQITENSKAYGLEESILEKTQGVSSENSQVGLADMGSQPCSDIVYDKALTSKSFEIKRMGMSSEDPCRVKNLATSPENVIDNTKNTESASAAGDIGKSIHKFDPELRVGANLLQERRCQLGVEGSTVMPSSHEQLHEPFYESSTFEHRMLPSPNVRISGEARSSPCPKRHEFSEIHSDSVSNQLPGPDHVEFVSVQLQVHIGELTNVSSYDPSELQQENLTRNSKWSGRRDKRTSKRLENINTLTSSRGSDRVLRSRSKDKSIAEFNDDVLNQCTDEGVKRKQRKKRQAREAIADEFSRIRKNLSYMLNRISYERSLIDAYTGEGWKGLSLEKIKPEKELQRATSEIVKRKLRIRDLFQRLDSLCAEGKLPEALFDSEGMIDSEDIFCAKCGSKDLTADNDIILCDGACDRGFHQYCLEPPLHAEDVPPADQGWLCPGCDCKVDCVDLLNESQGTNLSVIDSWEKVFPEVATAENAEDPNLGLPSDDSDDADYDPHAPQVDEDEENESSSDESGSNIASDKLGAPLKDNCMGLPSDDSEDDDFDPDAPDREKVEEESSSSDFTSDSEDLAAAVGNVMDEVNSYGDGGRRSSKNSFGKNKIVKGELQSLLDRDTDKDISICMPEKRHVERLDYKKLYDEEFGDKSSDSSDDEDWSDTVAPRKRKRGTDNAASALSNGNFTTGENMKHNKNEAQLTPRRRTSNRMDSPSTNSITTTPHKSSTPGSTGGRARSTYRRLGEAVTQRLHEAFKENQYPELAASEKLAEELGITTRQVRKWFENARWSFNHPSGSKVRVSAKDVKMESPMPQPSTGPRHSSPEMISNGIPYAEPSGVASMPECIDKDVEDSEVGSPQTIRESYNSSHLGKMKEKVDNLFSGSDKGSQAQAIGDDSAKASEPQPSSRRQTRSKSKA